MNKTPQALTTTNNGEERESSSNIELIEKPREFSPQSLRGLVLTLMSDSASTIEHFDYISKIPYRCQFQSAFQVSHSGLPLRTLALSYFHTQQNVRLSLYAPS